MTKAPITNYNELLLQIARLREEKLNQEELLKSTVHEFSSSFNLSSLFKGDFLESSTLSKHGLTTALNFAIGMIYSRKHGFKKLIGTVILKEIANLVLRYKFDEIKSFISNLFNRESIKEPSQH